MELLERIFLSFLQSSLTASVVILIVISILKIFHNHLSIRVKNALWILVLLKLLMPIIPETNISLFNILYEKYGSVVQSQTETNNFTEAGKQSQVSEENSNSINYNNGNYSNSVIGVNDKIQENNKELISGIFKIVSCIWGVGLVFASLALLRFEFKLNRRTKDLRKYDNIEILTVFNECRNKLNIKSRIPLYVYDEFKSPCIVGIVKPRIYIPKYILSIKDNNQISHIFLHELMHYKRKDLFYNFFSIAALLIHWFNPLVWLAIKQMKLYREYGCDACVLEFLKEEENTDYGMTLLSLSKMLLNKGSYSQVPIFFETHNQIKNRIWFIKGFKKGSYKMTVKAVIGCILAAFVILTNNLAVKALNAENIIQTTNIESNGEEAENNTGSADGISSGETYKLINVGSGKALDVYAAEKNDYSNVDIYDDNNTAAQRWIIYKNADGTYKLINTNSMKALDVYAAEKDDYSNVDIYTDNETDAQKWNIDVNDDGTYKLSNVNSNKILDVYAAGADNYTNVDVYTDNGTSAQKWELVRVS